MIMLAVLLVITIILSLIAVLILGIGGSIFAIIFGDLIVFIFIMWLLFFRSKKKNKNPKK